MRGNQKNKDYVFEWSPETAYAVGLITTDGNLSPDRRHIILVSKDIQLLNTFKRCLNVKNKLGNHQSGYAKTRQYYKVQLGNVRLYRFLIGIGLMPNKSKKLKALKIPNKYFFDFLRGCFDGDGTIYSYWDPRWHSSYMFYIVFASGSLSFLKWLRKTIEKLTGVSGKIKKATGSFQLAFAKATTKILFARMFYSPEVPCLKRKFDKAQRIFKTNFRHQAQVAKLVHAHV